MHKLNFQNQIVIKGGSKPNLLHVKPVLFRSGKKNLLGAIKFKYFLLQLGKITVS